MSSDIRTEVKAANTRFANAFEHGNAASVADLYTSDAELFPANSDAIRGTAAISAFWEGVIKLGITGARLETSELEAHGDTAIELGRYRLFAGADTVADHGKYLVIWKHQAGAWKLHRDIWTTSQPAPTG